MFKKTRLPTYVYPALGSPADLWFVRLSGQGIGSSFYSYFHAVVLAEKYDAKIIAPPWFLVKIGPFLRGERSKRLYWGMFKPFDGEIRGSRKFFTLLSGYSKRAIVELDGPNEPKLIEGALNVVMTSRKFTFEGLHPYRDTIRKRLLGIISDPIPPGHNWGQGEFIAVHVRLGDFAAVTDVKLICSGTANIRLPLSWYVNVIRALRERYPDKPIRVFSDGRDEEIQPLLELGASPYRSGSDIMDLLAMSSASIFVGSNSTYSRWAAFLGDMPSIWLKKEIKDEKPTSPGTPILYIPIDGAETVLWHQDAWGKVC